jgi:hypothetical protein
LRFSQRRILRWLSAELLRRVVGYNFIDVSEVLDGFFFRVSLLIARMIQAASTSETSANFYCTALRNNPENSQLVFTFFFLFNVCVC